MSEIELTKIKEWITSELKVNDINEIPKFLLLTILKNDISIYESYLNLVDFNLEIDYLQKFYQYYFADRENLGQDYTPKSLAKLISSLTDDSVIVDVCCGSGALSIQQWVNDNNKTFELYEFDDKVIPFLLFNMVIRNIDSIIYHSDVLSKKIFNEYKVIKGEKFGRVINNDYSNI